MYIREFRKPYSWTDKQTGKLVTVDEKMLEFTCDQCSSLHTRTKKHYNKMRLNPNFTEDWCNKCWQSIQNNLPDRKLKNSEAQKKRYQDPGQRKITSDSMKGKVNIGDQNPMKCLSTRKKVSQTRSRLMQNPDFRKKFVQGSIDAWKRGCYLVTNDANCRCKWHTYTHSSGIKYKVQGTWELKFIEWLDKNNMQFECHRGRIEYVDENGYSRSYYPDFFVYDWNSYVDPKADHWYKKQIKKFDLLREQHPDKKILVLTKQKLLDLGVNL